MDRKIAFGMSGFEASSNALVHHTAPGALEESSLSSSQHAFGFANFSNAGGGFSACSSINHTFDATPWKGTSHSFASKSSPISTILISHPHEPTTTFSTPTYDPTLPSRFSSLAPEIRLCIYQYLFTGAVVSVKHKREKYALAKRSSIPAILQTCRLCYDEARAPFYSLATFITNRYWIPELTDYVFAPGACQLLRNLTVCTREIIYLPTVGDFKTALPSLQNLAVHCSADLSRSIPFGLVEDVSDVMRISGYDYPLDTGRRARVHGMMLRWLSIMLGGDKLVRDLWTTHKQLRQADGSGLNFSLEFGVEFGQCVYFFEHTSLFRLAKDRDSLWWKQGVAAADHEDIPADLDDVSEEDNVKKCPGAKGCRCYLCLPGMVDDSRWKVQCVFDARSWIWTINVANHWWKCGELDGQADLERGQRHLPERKVIKVDEDLGTAPPRKYPRGYLMAPSNAWMWRGWLG